VIFTKREPTIKCISLSEELVSFGTLAQLAQQNSRWMNKARLVRLCATAL
jgi:hypothetical protein